MRSETGTRRPRWHDGWTLTASLGAFAALWSLAALAADRQILPAPWTVAERIAREAEAGDLFAHVGATLTRVAVAFTAAMAIGAAIGLWMGRARRTDRFLDPWLVILLNLPALVTITLCYLWIGLDEVAAVVAVAINKIPLTAAMLREGARALDPALDDMARVFRFGGRRWLGEVALPQLGPYFAASARTGLSLIWKIVLVVELLGRPNGVGFQIHMSFSLFDVAGVLAYSVTFIAVMLLIEKTILQPLERRANRWRRR